MGSEGGGGRFFHLFDWNRKSRKKLFSGGNASSGKPFFSSASLLSLLLSDGDIVFV